uniref:Uncharacterized protein LOC111119621 isoform X7 n=1 Tax=Crassostrea virginica TaxID=6565 RepID=A0A8B8CMT6_CRAVI|nr:uncharacterized protein LOC111119621 isoform X7 [Crassostrea virginica]
MATLSSEDNIKWSDETFSIREVADNNLPTVVKVADGYYSENEAESFSNGDLIKLDFKKSYSKVRAQCVGGTPKEDVSGYVSPDRDILIPLGYKGKLKVECLKSTFNSVEELIEHFPHFVITGRPLTGKRGVYSQEEFRIDKGVKLQLDRVIPEAGLVCKIDGKEVLLVSGQLARFHLEEDEKRYTIREVIENFVLPQYIRFVDSDFEKIVTSDLTEAIDNISQFQGYLKLLGLVKQEVVVGHHKPSGIASTLAGTSNQRAIAILPLDSESVRNIEVYLPVYEEENDYEFFLARNFSTNVNLDVVDGGLYLEFNKSPKIHLLNTEDVEKPPPRPPPPPVSTNFDESLNPEIQNDVNKTEQPKNSRESPPHAERKPPNSQTKTNKRRKPPSIPGSTETAESPTSPDPAGRLQFSNTKETHHSPQIPRPIGQRPKPPTPVQTDESSDDETENPYDEIEEIQEVKSLRGHGETYSKKTGLDFAKLPKTFRYGLKMVHHELRKLKRTRSTDSTSIDDLHVLPSKKDLNPFGSSSDDDDDEPVEYDYPDLTKLASMPRPKPVSDVPRYQASMKMRPDKPVGKIQPMSRETNADKKFKDLTSAEVVSLFRMTTLPGLASACEKEGLDGSFLSSLNETQLKKVFKLSALQLIKVNKIINDGWRPNTK